MKREAFIKVLGELDNLREDIKWFYRQISIPVLNVHLDDGTAVQIYTEYLPNKQHPFSEIIITVGGIRMTPNVIRLGGENLYDGYSVDCSFEVFETLKSKLEEVVEKVTKVFEENREDLTSRAMEALK